MAFPGELSDLLIERDRQGSARQLRHLLPFASTRTTPREVALAYLEEIVAFNRNNPPHQSLYPIEPKDLRHLSRTIGEAEGPASQSKNAELRWRPDRVIRRTVSGTVVHEVTIVTLQQTNPGGRIVLADFDVLGGGIRITVHHRGAGAPQFFITGSSSTLVTSLFPISPVQPKSILDWLFGWLLGSLGLRRVRRPEPEPPGSGPELLEGKTLVYRPKRHRRPGRKKDRTDFVVKRGETAIKVIGSGGEPVDFPIPHRLTVDTDDGEILHKEWLVSGCNGDVFKYDPGSAANARPAARPSSRNDVLKSFVTTETLGGLPNCTGRLEGVRVVLQNPNWLGRDGPVGDYTHDPRTHHFAAVSAYHHADTMMKRIEDFGFAISDYFDEQRSSEGVADHKITVVHRAPIFPGCASR